MGNFSEIKKDACQLKKLPKKIKLNSNRTVILQSVINEIKEHGRSSMSMEVCGVLIGNLCWDKEPYLMIDGRIEGKYADHQMASVTFTAETWDYIHSELSSKYPDKIIVGWYHTHPGFGIFLSQMDRFIHENFFGLKWQPAYVYDPQAETEGFFFWNEASLDPGRISIIPDKPADKPKPVKKQQQKNRVVISFDNKKQHDMQNLMYGFVCFIVFALLLSLIFNIFLSWSNEGNKQLKIENEKLKKQNKQLIEENEMLKGKEREIRRILSPQINMNKVQNCNEPSDEGENKQTLPAAVPIAPSSSIITSEQS